MKRKKQKGIRRKRKSSSNSYEPIPPSQQINQLQTRATNHLKRLAKDDKTSLDDFVKTTRAFSAIFKLAKLTNQTVEKLKEIAKKVKV